MAIQSDGTSAPQDRSAFPRDHATLGTIDRPNGCHPRSYATKVDGDCMAPIVRDGEIVCCEPVLPVRGDLAVFFFKGVKNGSLKRLIMDFHGFPVNPDSELVPVIQCEQLSPRKKYQSTGDKFDAIHRAPWVLRDGIWLALRPPPGWFVLEVMRATSRSRNWVALMINVDPDEFIAHRADTSSPSCWVGIPGKHRTREAAREALQNLLATRQ